MAGQRFLGQLIMLERQWPGHTGALELAHPLLQSLDDLLAEVRPLRQFLLNRLVNLDVSGQRFDPLLQLLVRGQELLGLSGLVLQLRCELLILQ